MFLVHIQKVSMLLLLTTVCLVYPALAAEYNLPDEVRPLAYDLMFFFDMDPATDFKFFGMVKIDLRSSIPTRKITLHAQDFTIDTDRVLFTTRCKQKQPLPIKRIEQTSKYQFLEVELQDEIYANVNYTLHIPFHGNVKLGLEGIYLSSYMNDTTKEKEYLITSHFETLYARKGFPCFDEPSFKAVFKISIACQRKYHVLSNMPLESTSSENIFEQYWQWSNLERQLKKEIGVYRWMTFEPTPMMSTYLVAIVIAQFTSVGTDTIKIWTRPDAQKQSEYAMSIAPKVLDYYTKHYSESYPLPKLDMVAIPDFFNGGMENWGLVLYAEAMLLYDKSQSTLSDKMRTVEVVAHEVAHQWFGNLVTMKWWSDLWLNEGFATFASHAGMMAVEPKWRTKFTKAITNMLSVYDADSLPSSRPVSSPIEDISQIHSIFDEMAYNKAAGLIRMMSIFMGEENFQNAISRYLKQYAYRNADRYDLWREISKVCDERDILPKGLTIQEVMETWTVKAGYPLVTCTRDYNKADEISVEQQRFLVLESNETSPLWWIPFSILSEGKQTRHWFSAQKQETIKVNVKKNSWLLINPAMDTFMRVMYDEKNWNMLIATLKSDEFEQIPEAGRIQLLDDAFQFAWTEHVTYEMALRLASYLERETKWIPLQTGLTSLGKIDKVLRKTKDYGVFQKYIRKLITDVYMKSGGMHIMRIRDEDDYEKIGIQVLTSDWACRMEVQSCIKNADTLFQKWMILPDPDEDNPIPLELRNVVLCTAIARGGTDLWWFAVERRKNAKYVNTKNHLTQSLACTPHLHLLETYLDWSCNDSHIRRQDAPLVIISVLKTPKGFEVAKNFIYDNIDLIAKTLADQLSNLNNIIRVLLAQITTQSDLDEFREWSTKNQELLSPVWKAVKLGTETASDNVVWATKHERDIVNAMTKITSDYRDITPLKNVNGSKPYIVNLYLLIISVVFINK